MVAKISDVNKRYFEVNWILIIDKILYDNIYLGILVYEFSKWVLFFTININFFFFEVGIFSSKILSNKY